MERGSAYKYLYQVYLTTKNDSYREALSVLLTALRPVSREQEERMWLKEPYTRVETWNREDGATVYSAKNTCIACGQETPIGNFCHNCGAPMTEEAVDILLKRMEAMKDAVD